MINTPSYCSIRSVGCAADGRRTAACLLVRHVQLVHGVEFELDLFPGFQGDLELGAALGRVGEDVFAFLLNLPALVAGLDAGFERDAVGRSAGRVAPRVTQGTAAKLQAGIVTENRHQRGHVPHVDAAGGDGEHAGHGAPVLIEEDAARAVFFDELVAHDVDPAEGGFAVAFELADHGAVVQVVAARQTEGLGQHAEVDAVVRVAVEHGVHGAVDVQQHAVVTTPVGETRVGGETAGQVVVHDDGRAQGFGVFGAFVHLFRGRRGDVQVVTLALAGLLLRLVDGFHHKVEAVVPAHEGLAVDVLVVFGQIQAAAQAFVHGAAVVLGGQAELGLDGAAQQRTAVFVELVALDLDTVGRAAAGLHIGEGEAHVFQAQGADGLEAEHIADQRGEDVDHRAFFEKVEGVGHEGVEAGVVARHVFGAVGAALEIVHVGQQVGPDGGPGASGGPGGDGGGGLFTGHARLRGDLVAGQDVGVCRGVVRHPVGFAVLFYARFVGLHCHGYSLLALRLLTRFLSPGHSQLRVVARDRRMGGKYRVNDHNVNSVFVIKTIRNILWSYEYHFPTVAGLRGRGV